MLSYVPGSRMLNCGREDIRRLRKNESAEDLRQSQAGSADGGEAGYFRPGSADDRKGGQS